MTSIVIDSIFDIFALVFFGLLFRTIWVAIKNPKLANVGIAAVAAGIAVFCALMGNPDRYQKISFSPSGGIVAEARQTIQQAQVTLEQLQKLAAALARGSLDEVAFSGIIFSGLSTEEKFNVRNHIVQRLKDIGLKEDEILEAQRVWIVVYCSIIEGLIEANVAKALSNEDKSFPNENIEKEILQLPKDNERNGLPLPDALKEWVSKKGINDPNTTELLYEYERIWTTGGMKNPALIPFGSNPSLPGHRK